MSIIASMMEITVDFHKDIKTELELPYGPIKSVYDIPPYSLHKIITHLSVTEFCTMAGHENSLYVHHNKNI